MKTMVQKKSVTGDSPAGSAGSKRKRVKIKAGQLAAVPLLDGTYALVHVASYHTSVIVAHFAHRSRAPAELLEGLEEAMTERLIAMLEVTSVDLRDGDWPVIGYKDPTYPAAMLDMKGTSYTSNASEWLLDAYYGLRPWDGMGDPRCYEKMLLPGVPVPPTVRYKRDFEKHAAGAPAAPAVPSDDTAAPPITDGPAEIHIEIKYPGDALPSIELLHRRQALEEALEKAGAGEVTDAGGGGGVMDIYLATEDVRRAMPLVEAAVKISGFEEDARIETTAVDDSGEEAD